MARVTVEDCVDKIPNRFELVLLASQRARAIAAGSPVTLERDNDKNPVVALREVADETISPEELTEAAIYSLRKHVEVDEPEEDDMSLLMAAQSQSDGEETAKPAAETRAPESAYTAEMSDFPSGTVDDKGAQGGAAEIAANYFSDSAETPAAAAEAPAAAETPAAAEAPAVAEDSADSSPAEDNVAPTADEPDQS